jgi:hypothetical protein
MLAVDSQIHKFGEAPVILKETIMPKLRPRKHVTDITRSITFCLTIRYIMHRIVQLQSRYISLQIRNKNMKILVG